MCGDLFSMLEFMDMECCGCFGFLRKSRNSGGHFTMNFPLPGIDDSENDNPDPLYGSSDSMQRSLKYAEEIFLSRARNGSICREVPVRETKKVVFSEDDDGNKMLNEYIRQYKIGSGSYSKVMLYRSNKDGKLYALKVFHKSYLLKLRVAPSETAMTDVLREVAIMKVLSHPNIVNLVEVMDDPSLDKFYMVLEYVEGKWACDGSGPAGGLGESTSRKYLRDIVAGLRYLHAHNIIHGDIKPDNLLVTSDGRVKIADFSVSQVFQGNNDVLRRSPGTPVFTAPECCQGSSYHGKAADTWAVGVTLYCMTTGEYPFLGETLQDTYDKVVKDPLAVPIGIDPQLKDLLTRLLCKDPLRRITLAEVAEHPWVVVDDGPIPDFICFCQRNRCESLSSQGEPR